MINNKVYLVWAYKDSYDSSTLYKICDSKDKAEDIREDLLEGIEKTKDNYQTLFGSNYDEDQKIINKAEAGYSKIIENFYAYQDDNEILRFSGAYIEEGEVI